MEEEVVNDLLDVGGYPSPDEAAQIGDPADLDREAIEKIARRIARIEWEERREVRPYMRQIERLQAQMDERLGVHARAKRMWLNAIEVWHRNEMRSQTNSPLTERLPFGGTSKLGAKGVEVQVEEGKLEALVEHLLATESMKHLVKVSIDPVAVRKACAELIEKKLPPTLNEEKEMAAVTDDGERIPHVTLRRPERTWKFESIEIEKEMIF